MKIGVIVALDKEYEALKLMSHEPILQQKNIQLQILTSGIGKVNAALRAMEMINNFAPDIIISSGVGGSLSPEVKCLDTVLSTTICYHDIWCGTPNKIGQIQNMPLYFTCPEIDCQDLQLGNTHLHKGLVVSGDWFVDTIDKAKQIKSFFPEALMVDMESAAIAQTCFLNQIPFISLRTICDEPLLGNNTQQYQNFWQNVEDKSFDICKQIILSLNERIQL